VSYDEALLAGDSFVIFEGDWGGQIYLVCPMHLVRCSLKTLSQLLTDMDRIAWSESEGTGMFFERHEVGDGIAGGMGGGHALAGLWIHRTFAWRGLRKRIQAVLSGERPALRWSSGKRR